MTAFKPIETYSGDYTYSNSREAITRLPFPYPEDQYMYSMNVEPHVPFGQGALRAQFDIDEHYISECHHRAQTLESEPGVHYAALPQMMEAAVNWVRA